ncbi:salt stress-induced hydrophobic peptide ESI3-like [Hibiscus syriacus]|uniref:salt stress-induced hydrophobic peptide ESI3-like n=1 Tax=Hibiscus syriacus TaxID=106335 RepID=UPI001922F168|nr:salt stress-induced hydrophobic peptide ESI3-like [Hibiscus syriacus]
MGDKVVEHKKGPSVVARDKAVKPRVKQFGLLLKIGSETFLEVILAILLPPVGVFLRYACGAEFWIDLVLTLLGYIPGIIYVIYVLVGYLRAEIFSLLF